MSRHAIKQRKWLPRDDRELAKHYPTMDTHTLALLLHRTYKAVRSRAKVLRLRKKKYRHYWTEKEHKLFCKLYPDTPSKHMAVRFNTTLSAVYQCAKKLGLHKSAKYLASVDACRLRRGDNVGASYRFAPGHVPANKGLRRPGYAKEHGRMAQTIFKKGQRSGKAAINYKPVGSTRIIEGYLYRKVSDIQNVAYTVNWKLVHVLLWEKANGQVPVNHVVVFKDRNAANIVIENLECISRKELMSRNTIHRMEPELKETIMLAGYLKRRIHTIQRRQHGQEQAVGLA